MDRVGGRQEKMEGHCSTCQSPQWAVVPMEEEEEEEEEDLIKKNKMGGGCNAYGGEEVCMEVFGGET